MSVALVEIRVGAPVLDLVEQDPVGLRKHLGDAAVAGQAAHPVDAQADRRR